MRDPAYYCALCGCWALEQTEGFCSSCFEYIRTKPQSSTPNESTPMNIADGVVAEAKEVKLSPAAEVLLSEFAAKVKDLLMRPDFCLVLIREGWIPAKVASDLIKSAETLRQFLVDHPVLDFDVPDEIWVPFIEAIQRTSTPPAPSPESPGPSAPRQS